MVVGRGSWVQVVGQNEHNTMYENYTTLALLCYSTKDRRPPAQGVAVVQEQLKRKRNNVELIFVFKYKVNIGKLSNFVSTINWSKTLSKGLARTSLKTRTTMRTDCLRTGKFPYIISYTMRLALPFKYPKK